MSAFLEEDRQGAAGFSSEVDIAVIRLPGISDFTDFAAFSNVSCVRVRYAGRPSRLGKPDLVVLPGTKSTIDDLLWMRQNGLETSVLELAEAGVPIWGICGGYQMLGEALEDPLGIEGEAGRRVRGMGLLPVKTVFEKKNGIRMEGAFAQVEGIFEELSGMAFQGCEVRMGRTEIDRENGPADTARIFHGRLEVCRPLSYLLDMGSPSKKARQEGWSRGNVYGGCVHGIFGQEGVAGTIVNALRKEKAGLSELLHEESNLSGNS